MSCPKAEPRACSPAAGGISGIVSPVTPERRRASGPNLRKLHMHSVNPHMILVGAYERDNFGDLLFLLQTRHYAGSISSNVVASAPFSANAGGPLPESVEQYASAIARRPPDAVWAVGGEVGSTSVADAFLMSASSSDFSDYQSRSKRARARYLRGATGLDPSALAYLPRMSAVPHTHGSALIVNSVGLSGLRGLWGSRRENAIESLREATFISVRDQSSSDFLRTLSIEHRLAPDLIHSISLNHEPGGEPEPDVALIQVKSKVLTQYGPEIFADTLSKSRELKNFRLRLFPAGLARGHDSLELYARVVRSFRKLAPAREISISRSLLPWEKADEIARCGLWIGTSLHGLIVSTAYDVPRVGLELQKLVSYGETWGESMPVGVSLHDLDGAVEQALVRATTSRTSGRAFELAHMAEANAKSAVAELLNNVNVEARTEDRAVRDIQISKRRSSVGMRLRDSSLLPMAFDSSLGKAFRRNPLLRKVFGR